MNRWRTLCTRIRNLIRRRSADAEMSAELQAHIDALAERNVASGMSADEARYAALSEFGGVEQIKERCRDERRVPWLENLVRDFRFAVRSLARSPGFTATALVTVTIGIGLSTSAFSGMNALFLRTLPYPDGDRLVRIFRVLRASDSLELAPANYLSLKSAATSFSAMSAFAPDSASFADPGQAAEQVSGLSVTADFLETLQVQPSRGRGFRADEDLPGRNSVVLITHYLWQHRYGGDPGVIGRSVRIDSQTLTIIGILPESFESIAWGDVQFIRPVTMWSDFKNDRSNAWFSCIARLKPGVSLPQSQAELTLLARRLARAYPHENEGDALRVTNAYGATIAASARALHWLMTGLATLVLVIACVNLSGLQFARALVREREFAIRAALGASPIRLVSPPLIESLLVATIGSVLGLLVGHAVASMIARYFQARAMQVFAIPIDAHVVIFTITACVVATLAFGLAPAWLAALRSTSAALKQSGQTITTSRQRQRIRRYIVLGQLALATLVITTAVGFMSAAHRLQARNLGWSPTGLYTGSLGVPSDRYPTDEKVRAFQQNLITKLQVIPGVETVALGGALPVWVFGEPGPLEIQGQPYMDRDERPMAMRVAVTSDYFAALKIPLRQGRPFAATFQPDAPSTVIVDEALARRFWPGEIPIGKRLRFSDAGPWLEIVGVVGDVQTTGSLSTPSTLHVYQPLENTPPRWFTVIIRTSRPPESLALVVRQVVSSIDPDLVVQQGGNLREILSETDPFVILNSNLGVLALIATGLAMLGVYAMLAQFSVQRRREFGIRIALGARRSDIFRLVLHQAAILFAIGALLGTMGALATSKILHRMMTDLNFPGAGLAVGIVALLALITWVASYAPARRAASVDPMTALRTE